VMLLSRVVLKEWDGRRESRYASWDEIGESRAFMVGEGSYAGRSEKVAKESGRGSTPILAIVIERRWVCGL
jgi:hypothetical protein